MPGGGRLEIKIENAPVESQELVERWDGQPGDYVAIRVIDTGTGMSADVLEHVFEPFFTTKDVGQGCGLGLSIIHGFAGQSDGFVTIESQEGEGATVSIYLPRTLGHHISLESGTTDAVLQQGQGETILLVEDEVAVRDATTKSLEKLGYRVLVAKDGVGATEIANNAGEIDLLLSDVVLPGDMNGIDISHLIRKQLPNLISIHERL